MIGPFAVQILHLLYINELPQRYLAAIALLCGTQGKFEFALYAQCHQRWWKVSISGDTEQ